MIIQPQFGFESGSALAQKVLADGRVLHREVVTQSPHGQVRVLAELALVALSVLRLHVLPHVILHVSLHLKLLRAEIAKVLIVVGVHALHVVVQRAGGDPLVAEIAELLRADGVAWLHRVLGRRHYPELVLVALGMFLLQMDSVAVARCEDLVGVAKAAGEVFLGLDQNLTRCTRKEQNFKTLEKL